MCGDVVASQENPEDVERLSRGFYYSILSMLGVPAFLLSVLVGVFVWNARARSAPPPDVHGSAGSGAPPDAGTRERRPDAEAP